MIEVSRSSTGALDTHALTDSQALVAGLRVAVPGSAAELEKKAEAVTAVLRHASEAVQGMSVLLDTDPPTETADATTVVAETTETLRVAVERVARLELELAGTPCVVPLPSWQLVQIVTALVGNAVEAVLARRERGGGAIRVCLFSPEDEDIAVLEVEDNGNGMDPDVRSRAGDPFFSTRHRERPGLGLPLVRGRVQRAGGEVLIDSVQDVGTTVRVVLPLVRRYAS